MSKSDLKLHQDTTGVDTKSTGGNGGGDGTGQGTGDGPGDRNWA